MAFVVIGCAAPAAKAGCAHPAGAIARIESARLILLEAAGALAADDRPTAPIPVSPCAGLRCSESPAPTPSSAHSATPRVEGWLRLTPLHAPDDDGSTGFSAGTAPLRPSHGAPAPFHPPR